MPPRSGFGRPAPIVVRAPRQPAPVVRVSVPAQSRSGALARRAGHLARRGGVRVARAAWDEKHTIFAVGAAGVLGYMEGSGQQPLPHIQQLGVYGTYGAGLWMLGRMTGSPTVKHAATGLLCVAVNRYARDSAASSAHAAPGAPQPGGLAPFQAPGGGAPAGVHGQL